MECAQENRCRYQPHLDYDRLAKAVVAEQERRAAKEARDEDIRHLEAWLPYFAGEKTEKNVEMWSLLSLSGMLPVIADAIRAYIKAGAG